MLKTHATKNAINKAFANIYSASYCDLYHLLKHIDASYYNAGACGWNWDGYIVDHSTIIVTGYRNFTGQHIDYDICKDFNARAKAIRENYKLTYNQQIEQLHELMQELLQVVKEA